METVFKIHEPHHQHQSQHLLIELGGQVLSLVFYNKEEKKVNALFQYNFKKNTPSSKIAEKLRGLFEKEVSHWQNIVSCNVFFNFRQISIVPNEFFKQENAASILSVFFGDDNNATVFHENYYEENAVFIYRVRQNIIDTIKEFYPGAQHTHSVAALLKNGKIAETELRCVVYYNSFRTMLYKNGRIQLVQYFDYNAPEDMAYHLVNICQQYQLNVDDVKLVLSGLMDTESQLYKCLHNYFLQIDTLKTTFGVTLGNGVEKQPEHFFSHLTALVLCV